MIEYDNRTPLDEAQAHRQFAFRELCEAWAANQLISEGKIQPILSAVYPLEQTGEAAYQVHHNLHEGKIGVLCLARGEARASTTRSSAPRSARTRSRCSGSTAHELTCCSRRSTTSPSR